MENGGLKLPLFSLKYKSLRIFWIKELLKSQQQLWKHFIKDCTNLSTEKLARSFPNIKHFTNLPSFYSEILELSNELLHSTATKYTIIENEHITFNQNLKINGSIIKDDHLENITIRDLCNADANLKSDQQIADILHVPIMKANSILSAIPKNWKKRLKEKPKLDNDLNLYIPISPFRKNVNICTSKELYWHLTQNIVEIPSAVLNWCKKLSKKL